MCQCEHLHVDELGPPGASIARWAWAGLAAAEAKNGTRPRTLDGMTQLLELLATCATARAGAEISYVSAATAVSLLGLTPAGVRWLAKRGRFPGAVEVGHCWLIPRSSVSHYRSTRNAA